MGSRIAAHFANIGIPSDLLDLTTEAAQKGVENAIKQRPGGFYLDSSAGLITPGNFDQHLERISACDWIIEAVTENLEAKRALWSKVAALRTKDAIASSNTSGIPLRQIVEGFTPEFKSHFLGTHFFNPPRYLHLLELIPLAETSPEIVAFVRRFGAERLGKGIVQCKDTPNFIANRIGSFFLATVIKIAAEDGFTVEETDALTGPLIGLPNSATFRLIDIVGLDVAAAVNENLYRGVPGDPWRERFRTTDFHQQMLERGWLGEKSGQGFYKRVGPERAIHAVDWKTFEYHPAAKPRFASAEAARSVENLSERLQTLVAGKDRAGSFLWKLFSDLLLYSAACIPEIADRTVDIDRAMRWGYGHALGPFELWDALGFEEVIRRLGAEGRALPACIDAMCKAGNTRFYPPSDTAPLYFDFASNSPRSFAHPGIALKGLRRVGANPGASLVDLGDGVLCVEFHSKMNALGEDHVSMVHAGLAETERNFEAMVIANQGETFSAGANIALVLLAAQNEEWEELDLAVRGFQQMNLAIKYAKRPVVVAPFSRTLGGGCEVCLHAARVQASAETYMGLVEVGVGLIPAGGGTKEMLLRLRDPRKAGELIGMAKVSTSAEDARQLRYLSLQDQISINPDTLIDDAKKLALTLVKDYVPPSRPQIKAGGDAAYAMLKLGGWSYRQGNYASDYDVVVFEKLAYILSGGRLSGEQLVSEQYLLDLEREAFLSLCGNPQTQARMAHTLKTGKPLRN